MNRGTDRQSVFHDDADRLVFERLLGQAHEHHHVEVHAYCLMDNHFHVLMHCPRSGISAAMQQLSSSYTRIVNERLGRDGPLFRGRFHSVVIETERQILETAAYIHRNPIDIVPLAALEAYRWSSFGVYGGRRTRPPWLEVDVIEGFATIEEHRSLVSERCPDRFAPPPPALGPQRGV
jgi:putative transposase